MTFAMGGQNDLRQVLPITNSTGEFIGYLKAAFIKNGNKGDPFPFGVTIDQPGISEASRERRAKVITSKLRTNRSHFLLLTADVFSLTAR
jgi:hypothetical protein